MSGFSTLYAIPEGMYRKMRSQEINTGPISVDQLNINTAREINNDVLCCDKKPSFKGTSLSMGINKAKAQLVDRQHKAKYHDNQVLTAVGNINSNFNYGKQVEFNPVHTKPQALNNKHAKWNDNAPPGPNIHSTNSVLTRGKNCPLLR